MNNIPTDMLPPNASKRVAAHPDTGCWLWSGEVNRNGYGRVWVSGKRVMAHRAIYEAIIGGIPAGMVLDHLCRNRLCCNPLHLEPVTVRENTHRGEAVLFQPMEVV